MTEITKDNIFKRIFSVKYFMVRFLKDFIYEEWVEKIEEENLNNVGYDKLNEMAVEYNVQVARAEFYAMEEYRKEYRKG